MNESNIHKSSAPILSRWLKRIVWKKKINAKTRSSGFHTATRSVEVYKKSIIRRNDKEASKKKYFPYPKMGVHLKMFIFISFKEICSQLCWTTMSRLLNKRRARNSRERNKCTLFWVWTWSGFLFLLQILFSSAIFTDHREKIPWNAHNRLITDYTRGNTQKTFNRRWKASWNLSRGQMVSVKTFYVVFDFFFSLDLKPIFENFYVAEMEERHYPSIALLRRGY